MHIKNYNKAVIFYHSVLWCFFIFLPLYLYVNNLLSLKIDIPFINIHLTSIFFSILLFYFNYFYAIPKLYYEHKQSKYLLSILISFFILIYLYKLFINNFIENGYLNKSIYIKVLAIKLSLAFFISLIIKLIIKNKNEEIEKKYVKLNSLKAQINPHFLFNTLNGIYAQSLMNSQSTSDSIAKLASIMRYIVDETENEKVDIHKEIKYLNEYIEFQKLRLTNNTKISYNVKGEIKKGKIHPLLFINFIDNAFKYGVSNEQQTEISIMLFVDDNHLEITIKNQIISTNLSIRKSISTGLKNAKKRLDLLFNGNYILKITECNDKYIVYLKIPIQ